MALPEQIVAEPASRSRIAVDEAPHGWTLRAGAAEAAARRREFRRYLERFGDPSSDFHGAEAVYGELVNSCVVHAPGTVEVTFSWDDATLHVVDAHDRLRAWPFCRDDMSAEATHHGFAVIRSFAARIRLARAADGTRVSVRLPVRRAAR